MMMQEGSSEHTKEDDPKGNSGLEAKTNGGGVLCYERRRTRRPGEAAQG